MDKIINIFFIRDRWGDYSATLPGFLLIIMVVALVIYGLYLLFRDDPKEIERNIKRIKLLGYDDMGDLDYFLDTIDAVYDDFIKSKGLRKQYELFRDGKSSEFYKQAVAKKEAQDAEESGRSSGFATGIIVGNAMKE